MTRISRPPIVNVPLGPFDLDATRAKAPEVPTSPSPAPRLHRDEAHFRQSRPERPPSEANRAGRREKPGKPQIPAEVLQQYPHLSVLQGVLRIEDYHEPLIQRHVAELAMIPPSVLQRLRKAGLKEIHIANRSVPELASNQKLRGQRPRGWPDGKTWDTVAGVFNPTKRTIAAGRGEEGSESVVIHETAHALGWMLKLKKHPQLIEAHKRLYDKLDFYLRQGGPGAEVGRDELLAEGIADLLILGTAGATRKYDADFIRFVTVEALGLPPETQLPPVVELPAPKRGPQEDGSIKVPIRLKGENGLVARSWKTLHPGATEDDRYRARSGSAECLIPY